MSSISSQSLTALPVSGDAFILQKEKTVILVDSGGSGIKLANLIHQHLPSVVYIDIAVCTHADRDHAGGFATFLKYWRKRKHLSSREATIGQFWLPGSWVDLVPDLLMSAKKVADALIKELDRSYDTSEDQKTGGNDQSSSEILIRHQDPVHNESSVLTTDNFSIVDGNEASVTNEITQIVEPVWMTELRGLIEQILRDEPAATRAFDSARRRIRYRQSKGKISLECRNMWISLIDTAERIRRIASSAIEYNIKIRWFSNKLFQDIGYPSGGIDTILIPLNSVEIVTPPVPCIYWSALCLTLENQESLVFYANSLNCAPVLFCADSPIGSGKEYLVSFPAPKGAQTCPLVLATAPHHGAESNSIAYKHVVRWFVSGSVIWVRSGGTKRPGATFCALPWKFCTNCKIRKLPSTPVHINVSSHSLTAPLKGYICSCE